MPANNRVTIALETDHPVDWFAAERLLKSKDEQAKYVATELELFTRAGRAIKKSPAEILRIGGQRYAKKLVAAAIAARKGKKTPKKAASNAVAPPAAGARGQRDPEFARAHKELVAEGAQITPSAIAWRVNANAKKAQKDGTYAGPLNADGLPRTIDFRAAVRWMERSGVTIRAAE